MSYNITLSHHLKNPPLIFVDLSYKVKDRKVYKLIDSFCVCLYSCTFWRTRSVTISLAWTSMVMRAVMILRCKVGSCPRTNAAKAFSLCNTQVLLIILNYKNKSKRAKKIDLFVEKASSKVSWCSLHQS